MNAKTRIASCLTALLAMSATAHAEPTWYMKSKLGLSSMEADLDVSVEDLGYNQVEEDTTSWGLAAGMMFNRQLGLQLGYSDYGDFAEDYAYFDPASEETIAGIAGGELEAVSISLIARVAFSDAFSGYGSIGLASWDAKFRDSYYYADENGILDAGSLRASDDGTDLIWAVGLQVELSEGVDLGFEYERLDAGTSPGGLDIDIMANTFSATVQLRL